MASNSLVGNETVRFCEGEVPPQPVCGGGYCLGLSLEPSNVSPTGAAHTRPPRLRRAARGVVSDAAVSAGPALARYVLPILLPRRYAEIRSPIVQLVAVAMIGLKPVAWLKPEHEPTEP